MSEIHAGSGAGDGQSSLVDHGETEVTLIDTIVAMGEQKKFIFLSALITTILGIVVSLLLPPVFTGQTVIMPPQQSRSGLAALANLGDLAGLGDSFGSKTSDGIYIGLLESDAIANDLIDRFKLKERYRVKLTSQARMVLRGKVKIISDKKTGFITVTASDKSPEFSAELANAYVDELRKMLDHLAITDAQQRRVFFQRQIEKTLGRLSQAQVAFDQAQKQSGVVSLDEQVSSTIRASADLKAKIAALEVQLQTMRTYATEANPEYQRISAEVDAMRAQLSKLEQGNQESGADKRPVDTTALANIRTYREVKYQEALLDQFRKQLELAQVDEAKEGPLVQQVDIAITPDRRSAPKRAIIVLISLAFGLLIGASIARIRAGLCNDKHFANQFRRVKQAWQPLKSRRNAK